MSKTAFAIVTAGLVLMASDARAEIVVFKNGRTMSVKSVVVDANTAVMRLREGGEVSFPASIIARVDPDEVPYPETANEPAAAEIAAVDSAPSRVPDPGSRIPDEVLATRPFAELISTVAEAHQVDKRLVHAVIQQESGYQARARSKKGAKGLMQLMPGTARQYGVRNSYDPKANLEAGVRHLKDLMSRLDLPMALAAYNAGEATIKRYGGLPPFPETQNYVRSILRRVGSAGGN
ncbi:MAG TPA: lytic transglycosylase domain-containing protein [Vicinamibacterales bacterium]|nr:lytic transglycosylase domain-containing protein [Vicinamibacterales bacterium]